MSQIKILLQQGVINTKYDSILKLNNVWNVPQYAVFYYKDRVEVYRCEPEYQALFDKFKIKQYYSMYTIIIFYFIYQIIY